MVVMVGQKKAKKRAMKMKKLPKIINKQPPKLKTLQSNVIAVTLISQIFKILR
jgi:hypothetical protein